MHKYDFELKKLQIRSANIGNVLSLVKHAATMATIIGCVYLVFAGFAAMAAASPDSVKALALLAEKMNVSAWFGYIGTAAAGGGWLLERRGKKRLLKGYSADRKAAESEDPYASSSGLNESGDAPKLSSMGR